MQGMIQKIENGKATINSLKKIFQVDVDQIPFPIIEGELLHFGLKDGEPVIFKKLMPTDLYLNDLDNVLFKKFDMLPAESQVIKFENPMDKLTLKIFFEHPDGKRDLLNEVTINTENIRTKKNIINLKFKIDENYNFEILTPVSNKPLEQISLKRLHEIKQLKVLQKQEQSVEEAIDMDNQSLQQTNENNQEYELTVNEETVQDEQTKEDNEHEMEGNEQPKETIDTDNQEKEIQRQVEEQAVYIYKPDQQQKNNEIKEQTMEKREIKEQVVKELRDKIRLLDDDTLNKTSQIAERLIDKINESKPDEVSLQAMQLALNHAASITATKMTVIQQSIDPSESTPQRVNELVDGVFAASLRATGTMIATLMKNREQLFDYKQMLETTTNYMAVSQEAIKEFLDDPEYKPIIEQTP